MPGPTPLTTSASPSDEFKSEYDSRWTQVWKDDKRPVFDQGYPAASLVHLLSTDLSVKGKRVLIPGCGTGYDVVAFAQAGAALSLGLDLVADAVQEATMHRDSLALEPEVLGRTQYIQGDFFTFEEPGGLFDVGYDYTFLCAMHPDLRTLWAKHWARLLRPGGELVALMYPVAPSRDPNEGPPFPLSVNLYKSLLEPIGFELTFLEPVPAERSKEARAGIEIMSRWARK